MSKAQHKASAQARLQTVKKHSPQFRAQVANLRRAIEELNIEPKLSTSSVEVVEELAHQLSEKVRAYFEQTKKDKEDYVSRQIAIFADFVESGEYQLFDGTNDEPSKLSLRVTKPNWRVGRCGAKPKPYHKLPYYRHPKDKTLTDTKFGPAAKWRKELIGDLQGPAKEKANNDLIIPFRERKKIAEKLYGVTVTEDW